MLEFRERRDWKQFHRLRSLLLALAGEVGEAAAEVQWVADEDVDEWLSDDEHRDALASELADVLAYLLLVAHEANIDLGDALLRKVQLNELRFPPPPAETYRDDAQLPPSTTEE